MLQLMKVSSIVLIFFSLTVFANEAANPEAASESTDAAKKEDEASKKATKLPEWIEIQNKLNTLDAKITAKKDSIGQLVVQKKQAASSDEAKRIVDTMVSEHKEMVKMTQEYEKLRTILNYRYPERARQGTKKYSRIQVKQLSEIEEEYGVEGKLNKNIKKMRQQYGQTDLSDVEQKKLQKEKDNPKKTTIEDETVILSK